MPMDLYDDPDYRAEQELEARELEQLLERWPELLAEMPDAVDEVYWRAGAGGTGTLELRFENTPVGDAGLPGCHLEVACRLEGDRWLPEKVRGFSVSELWISEVEWPEVGWPPDGLDRIDRWRASAIGIDD